MSPLAIALTYSLMLFLKRGQSKVNVSYSPPSPHTFIPYSLFYQVTKNIKYELFTLPHSGTHVHLNTGYAMKRYDSMNIICHQYVHVSEKVTSAI